MRGAVQRESTTRRLYLPFACCVLFFAFLLHPLFVEAGETATDADAFDLKLPLGISRDVWTYFVPKDNPMTAEKVALGRELFFEKRLSADASISCAGCHAPERAFTDGKRVAEGIGGRVGTRNSP